MKEITSEQFNQYKGISTGKKKSTQRIKIENLEINNGILFEKSEIKKAGSQTNIHYISYWVARIQKKKFTIKTLENNQIAVLRVI